MVQFYLHGFIKSREMLDIIVWKTPDSSEALDSTGKMLLISELGVLAQHCEMIGLDSAALKLSKTRLRAQVSETFNGHDLRDSVKEVNDRINEALSDLVFMYIPTDKAKFHSQVDGVSARVNDFETLQDGV
jgi:hypothetical protein